MTDNTMMNAALEYAAQGFHIFPVVPRDKKPLTSHGFKDASTDPEQIRAWWTRWPDANIGIATGKNSGLWVLDIDGMEGEATLKALENAHGCIPPTWEVITGGGGRHLYFRLPQGLEIYNSAGKIGLKIDVRGDGGYIVVPPSTHPSGGRYVWSVDSGDTAIEAPSWLIDLVINKPRTANGKSDIDWDSILQGVTEGSRNDCAARLSGKLLAHGLEPKFSFYLMAAWNDARCKPPLPHDELYKTFVSIAQRNLTQKGGL